jgi:hypothetical protein
VIQWFKNFLTPANAGETEVAMSDTKTATPPAASGGLTREDVQGLIQETLKTSLAEALKPVTDSIAALKPKPMKEETAEKPLTAADVKTMMAETLKGFQSQQSQTQARTDFIRSKLADLPATYQNLLPETADAAALAKAEQDIRARYKAEVGDKIPVAAVNSNAGGAAATGKIDLTKLSPTQLLEHGITTGAAKTASTVSQGAAGGAAAK